MEKSITAGLEEYIRTIPGMKEIDAKQCSPLVLAYVNEEEHGVYRRGRNARSVSPAKNQSITDYRRATGFEALIGHLYLTGQYERLTELVSIGLESIEKEIKEKGAEHAGK